MSPLKFSASIIIDPPFPSSLKDQITSNKKHTRVLQCNKETMGDKATLLILLLVLCHGVAVTMGYWVTELEEGSPRPDKLFMLQKSKSVAKTDAGEMRVLESYGGRVSERRLHIGFITMEPRSLFVPQYLDSSLVMFVRSGTNFYFLRINSDVSF